jgi:HemY protein
MFRFLVFLLIVLGLAALFAWIADNPGNIYLQWEWLAGKMGRPGEEVGIPLTIAITGLVIFVVLIMIVSSLLRGIFGMPGFITRFFDNRRKERGYRALSRGLIAASSGDVDTARSLTKESGKLLKNDPLVALLGTQTALLEGDRDAARENFKTMLENEETRMVALRGLFLEAERQNEPEAARHYAEEAVREAPSLPWAGNAKLRYQATDGDWDSAIQTLEANRSAGLLDRATAKRQRAILLTAKAISVEQAEPDLAKKLSKEAHKLAKDLVPAATTYARAASRLGDIRGASKIIEACWKQQPHPELAEAYATVRAGDSVKDRLKRAHKLAGIKANHPEGRIAVAVAAIDAKEWDEARSALESVLTSRPTERACLLMADIEEGQHGDQGRMRDWLSRAVRSPADEAWTADGHVSEEWMPFSPVSGEIDAFEWKVPVAQLGGEDAPVLTAEQLRDEAKPVLVGASQAEAPASIEPQPEIEDIKPAEIEEAELVTDEKEAEPIIEEDNKAAPATASTSETSSDESEAKPDSTPDLKPETSENNNKDEASSSESAENDNVVALEPSEKELEESAKEEKSDKETDKKKQEKKSSSPYSNTVEFPLERRPDDPGPHPEKEPTKKGFKLF